jgi:hypothetical protein
MGRPEAPLDPSESPLAAFADQLRVLRRGAGEPTYATMARRSDKSPTALSDAAGGRKMPTWPTVEAYVRDCGGDPDEWLSRWEALRPTAARVMVAAGDVSDAGSEDAPAEAKSVSVEAKPHGRARRRWWLIGAASGIGAVAILIAAAFFLGWPGSGGELRGGWAAPAVVKDGADPEDSGCASDPAEYQLDDAEVDYNGLPVGSAQLKYSPGCGVAWARFQPFSKADIPTHIAIHVDIVRPDDNNERSAFDAPNVGAPVYGNVLLSTSKCVYAAVWIGDKKSTSETHTHCFRGRTFVR